ncbi:MAG: pyrroline-5-carboxylate reductase, partial [Candidatus Omnitrophica bacterium]|nr:pyrroline-5-carboxylate reductase [Candidatus Omnitrophota bacterium]
KPQDLPGLFPELRAGLNRGTLIVSIAAGVKLSGLHQGLPPRTAVIRAMPNLPATVGQGMTVLAAGRYAGPAAVNKAKSLFASVGEVWVGKESQLDAVTALSGSGPAYYFLLTDLLASAGVRLGLPAAMAEALACSTAVGSGALLAGGSLSAKELVKAVASKGGTTEAALKSFQKSGLNKAVYAAVSAAARRSKQLGG